MFENVAGCATQAKLSSGEYRLHESPVRLTHILTAAEAQVDLLLAKVPCNARVLVLSGGQGSWRHDLERRSGAEGAALVATWDLRTSLTEKEAKAWASEAAKDTRESPSAFVVFFHDGSIGGSSTTCPQSGMPGFDDWGFEVVKAAGFLLGHGAHLVYTADDAFNPSADPMYPGMVFPLPGPGEWIRLRRERDAHATVTRLVRNSTHAMACQEAWRAKWCCRCSCGSLCV